ncbi:MAG TPA: serine hydrolase [Blastocatellia bacterium]|nr:serine hydrolase [Blastocatellia bacterium]
MKSQIKARLIYVLLLALVGAQVARAQEAPLTGFDDYVNKALKDWEVPGMAIAIVKDDKVLLAKGYGVRKLGDATLVDERTLFAIGSASKAFTAASIAMLVDEGKMKWDEPATKYLPGFQLFDPYVTRELTVRDMLTHRSGLERGDLLWYGTEYDRDEILRRVRFLKPSWSLRSRFGYQNILYLAAGQAVATASGKNWDEFVRQRIFTPLGMSSSSTSITALKTEANVASPHTKLDDKVQPIPWRKIDNIGPAGSINSNVTDMAQWVRLHLNQGTFKNERILSSGAVKEMHMPQTVMRLEGLSEKIHSETHFMTYGLGWFLQDYRGRKIVHHGGNIDGMSALVAMIPEEKLGVVMLTNMNGTSIPTAIMYRVFDAFLQAPQKDWSAELLKIVKSAQEQAATVEKKLETDRVKGTNPSLALAKYAGTYANEMYGEAKVKEQNGKLIVEYSPAMTGELEHWHFDTFRTTLRERHLGKPFVTFALNSSGKVDEMKFNIPNASDIAFKRAPEKAEEVASITMSEDELKKYMGKYESKTPPIEISIEMLGGKLKGVIPGQPVGTLVPVAANRFKVVVEGVPVEIFAEFQMADGRPKAMIIEQSGVKLTLLPKP